MVTGALWLALTAVAVSQAPPVSSPVMTREVYVAELRRLHLEIQELNDGIPAAAGSLIASVPARWIVGTTGGDVEVDSAWLRAGLAAWQRHPTASGRRDLIAALDLYLDDAARDPAPVPANAPATLDRILSTREFSRVRGPGAMEAFRQRILRWLIEWLGRAVGASFVPTITRGLVTLLVIVAIGVVAAVTYRSLRRHQRIELLHLAPPPTESRPWTALLSDARAAADGHDWREAVHLAYWTAIAFLESGGAWRRDRSRTPREYLGLIAPSSHQRAPLDAMTRLLEQVWYASATADAERFRQALTALEQLGCPSR